MQVISSSYDLVVIGSGPAGIHAAVQAAKLSKKVLVVEKNPSKIGGAWLHTGTLPSKTLREVLATIHSIERHVGKEWVNRISADLSMEQLRRCASQVSEAEESLVREFLESNHIQVVHGFGLLEGDNLVRVNSHDGQSHVVAANYIFIAAGSRPRRPQDIPFDGWRIVDSDDILLLQAIPKEMLIFGAGVIGCEYACIFQILGTKVTLVDCRQQLMEFLDAQIVEELCKAMNALGVRFQLGCDLLDVKAEGSRVVSRFKDQENKESTMSSDVLFFAGGRIPNTDHLGLEKHTLQLSKRGHVVVNQHFQSDIANVYAGGDVLGPPALAATAAEQGRHAACHMFGVATRPFPEVYPIGVYTIPELSSVGKSEQQLRAEGIAYVTGIAQYSEIARGNIRGDKHGMLKLLVCRETQQILGIHIVGEGACNLVHIGMAFMLSGGVVQDLVNMIFNFPTLAEGYRIAAFNALNKIFSDGVIKDKKASVKVKASEKKRA